MTHRATSLSFVDARDGCVPHQAIAEIAAHLLPRALLYMCNKVRSLPAKDHSEGTVVALFALLRASQRGIEGTDILIDVLWEMTLVACFVPRC